VGWHAFAAAAALLSCGAIAYPADQLQGIRSLSKFCPAGATAASQGIYRSKPRHTALPGAVGAISLGGQ